MLPSRGLGWSSQVIGIGRRRIGTLPSRQFSSSTVQHAPTRKSPLLSQNRSTLPRFSSDLQFTRNNLLIRNGAAVRFASSTPSPVTPSATSTASIVSPTDAAGSAAAPPLESVTPTSLDSATNLNPENLADVPHYIGYLKQLGLDYGYGPTATMEWVLEHVHVWGGTPWWASIALTMVLARLSLFKLYVNASDNAARMAHTAPITKPLTKKMMEAQARGDTTEVLTLRAEMMKINKRAGISYLRGFSPFIGGIAAMGQLFITRAMAKLPLHSLETGGVFWFPDLTLPDPYYILPLATAGVLHYLIRSGGETASTNFSPGMHKALMWGFPALGFAASFWMPAACQIGFFVQGLFSFIQTSLMRQQWFRSFFNITPLPKPVPEGGAAPSPYKGVMKRATSPVLSQEELNSRFESTSKSGLSKIISAPLAPIKGAMQPTIDSARQTMKERVERQQVKDEKKDAERYEAKRKRQLAAEAKRARELAREDRAARREQRMQKRNS